MNENEIQNSVTVENEENKEQNKPVEDKKEKVDISPSGERKGFLGAIPTIPEQDLQALKMYMISFKVLTGKDLTDEENKELEKNSEEYKAFIDMLASGKFDVDSILYRAGCCDKLPFNKKAVQGMVYGDKVLGIESAPIKKAKSENNIYAFKAALRGTSLKYITLFHSGFTIQILPPSLQDMIILQQTLQSEEVALAKDTATLVNSSKRSYLMDNIVTFLRSCIVKHPLILKEGEDIFKYISVLDYDIILAGLLAASAGSSVNLKYRCANTYKYLEEEKTYACDVEFPVKVNLEKMLFIEENYLPKESTKILSFRDKNTLTLEEVSEYRRELREKTNAKRTFKVETNDVLFEVKLSIPSVFDYVTTSTEFIQDVKNKVSEANTPENDYKETMLIRKLMTINKVSDITSTIEEMKVSGNGNEMILNDKKEIQKAIDDLMDDDIADKLAKFIEDFIEESTIAKICYPKSYCSKCVEEMKKNGEEEPDTTSSIHDLVPVNMLGFFYQAINILS